MGYKYQIRRANILSILIALDNASSIDDVGPKTERYQKFTRPQTTKRIIEAYRSLNRNEGDNITVQSLYKIIKDLHKEGLIIDVNPKEYDLSKYSNSKVGAPSTFYAIMKTPKHFLKLSKEFYSLHDKDPFSKKYRDVNIIITKFTSSDYAKNLINMDLINIIEKDLNLNFSKIEKETILNGLKTSIYSFWKVFDYYHRIQKSIEDKPYKMKELDDQSKHEFVTKVFKRIIESNLNPENIKKTLINKLQLGIGEYIEANEQHLVNYKIVEAVEKELGDPVITSDPDINEFTITYDVIIKLNPIKDTTNPMEYNTSVINKDGDIIISSHIIYDHTLGLFLPHKYR